MKKFLCVLLAALFTLVSSAAYSNVLYVKTASNGGNDSNSGTSWATAFATITQAIKSASANDEIRVAAGTYPERFEIGKVLTMSGGYPAAGGDTRDWQANETVIDGENEGRVIYTSAALTLDGFTVTRGYGSSGSALYAPNDNSVILNSKFTANGYAGARAVRGAQTVTNCSFIENTIGSIYRAGTVTDCVFTKNSGGYAIYYANTVTNCTFTENSSGAIGDAKTVTGCTFTGNSGSSGAAISSATSVTNCTFTQNKASYGGAITSASTISNCTFYGNSSTGNGGAVYSGGTIQNCVFTKNYAESSGGAIYISGSKSNVINCVFTENEAKDNGGGLHASYSSNAIRGCSFIGNVAAVNGGGVYLGSGTKTLVNCTFSGNSASKGGGIMIGSSYDSIIGNCTFVNNSAVSGAEFYTEVNDENTIVNTIFFNSAAKYIYNENSGTKALTLRNCAYASGSVFGSGTTTETNTVYISSWTETHAAEKVSYNGIEHTVFKLTSADTGLIRGGIISDGVPTADQIGVVRDTTAPSIGAIEYVAPSQNDNDDNNSGDDSGNGNNGTAEDDTDNKTDDGKDTGNNDTDDNTDTGNNDTGSSTDTGNDSPTDTDNSQNNQENNNNQGSTDTPGGNSTGNNTNTGNGNGTQNNSTGSTIDATTQQKIAENFNVNINVINFITQINIISVTAPSSTVKEAVEGEGFEITDNLTAISVTQAGRQALQVSLPSSVQGKNISDVKIYFVSKTAAGLGSVNASALPSGMTEGVLLDSTGGEITTTVPSSTAIASANLGSTGEYNVYLAQRKSDSSSSSSSSGSGGSGGGGGCNAGLSFMTLAAVFAFCRKTKIFNIN